MNNKYELSVSYHIWAVYIIYDWIKYTTKMRFEL